MTHSIDPDLDNLLLDSDDDDVLVLIDHITDNGEGRISLSSESCAQLVLAKTSGRISPQDVALISQELRRFGGNSILNLFRRGKGVAYKELLCDVADHLKVKYNKNGDCPQIEMVILLKVLEESIDRMSEQDREELFKSLGANVTGTGPFMMASLQAAIKASGLAAYKLSAIVAQATSTAILGRGLAFSTATPWMRGVGAFAGPVGWAVTGIWTAFDLASPAYRVTVPCVVQIAYMRQKRYAGKTTDELCPQCETPAPRGAKFCGECGHRLKP